MPENGFKRWIKRKRAEKEEWIVLQKRVQQKDAFIASVSREIEARLNVIRRQTDALLQKELTEETEQMIQDIRTAEWELQNMAEDILEFSELEQGNVTVEEQSYDLSALLKDTLYMAVQERHGKEIELIVDCEVDMPRELYGDAGKIRRVLYSLVRNAIQYTKEGGVIIRATKRKESYGVNLCLEVIDSGIGMSAEQLDLLFAKDTYGETARIHTDSGLGIGLAMTRRLIDTMQGIISVKSVAGTGSVFQVVLPQKVADEKPVVQLSGSEKMRFLVYTDQEKFRYNLVRDGYISALAHMAEQLDVPIDFCRNLTEVKRRIERVRYSHVFISGDEYLEEKEYFEALAGEMPVVMILNENAVEGKAEQFIHIHKPFYLPDVVSALNGERKEMVQNTENIAVSHWIDAKIGLNYCGGDQQDYEEVLQIYSDFAKKAMPELEDAYGRKDWAAYTTQVHSLKSSSLGIGAESLFELAKAQEAAARSCNEIELTKNHAKMMQRYKEVLAEIAGMWRNEG